MLNKMLASLDTAYSLTPVQPGIVDEQMQGQVHAQESLCAPAIDLLKNLAPR